MGDEIRMTKIPTEIYICVPRRSKNAIFRANIWANLRRKDTGEGIAKKWLLSFLDDVNVSKLWTDKTGYAGPFDINPKTAGQHITYVTFAGDEDYTPCKSEVITLTIDPNLLGTEITMEVTPQIGCAPLTIKISGTVYEVAASGSKKPPAYSLPLSLMVSDTTSTKRVQVVRTTSSYADGTFEMQYTFPKVGTYGVFVNFFGDSKYISAWSNNGRITIITVKEGLPLEFDKTVTITAKEAKQFKWILGDKEPTAPEGYARFADLDLDFGVLGIYWCFVKTTA